MEKLTFFLKISAFSLRLEEKRLKGNVLPHILGNIGIINTKKCISGIFGQNLES